MSGAPDCPPPTDPYSQIVPRCLHDAPESKRVYICPSGRLPLRFLEFGGKGNEAAPTNGNRSKYPSAPGF